MTPKAKAARIEKAHEAAQTFYMILRQFERGRISAAEMDKAIFQTVARHKYIKEYTRAATEAIKAKMAIDYIESISAEIMRAADES